MRLRLLLKNSRNANQHAVRCYSKSKYSFITTPIFYANAAPHIGHLYTAVIADASHRWAILNGAGVDAKFSTGTDEHGMKIARTAALNGSAPKDFCDKMSGSFRKLFDTFDISYTDYVRTTDQRHVDAVQDVWHKLDKRSLIYKDKYCGWYSVVDECFYPDNEVEDKTIGSSPPVKVVKGTQTVVDWVEEENYMFRLGDFRESTRKALTENSIVQPAHYLPLALRALDIEDSLSISRDSRRLSWGIPVPDDPGQTIYVWLDALVNYLTVNAYPNQMKFPAPSCQIVGKDIVKFHTVYWFAFLKALDLPMPKKLFVHGHWLVDGVKMSKSLGNVVNPMEAKDLLTVEGLRYFLLKQGVASDDSNFTTKKAIDVINSDLVNTIGNLLSRSAIAKLNTTQTYPEFVETAIPSQIRDLAGEIIDDLNCIKDRVSSNFDEMAFYRGIEEVLCVVRKANLFMQNAAPWKMEDGEALRSVLFVCYEAVRVSSILLSPIVPSFSTSALDRLNIPVHHRGLNAARFLTNSDITGRNFGVDQGPLLSRIQAVQSNPELETRTNKSSNVLKKKKQKQKAQV